MGRVPRQLALASLLSVLGLSYALARKQEPANQKDERARAVQALNRLTFGPRRGDVDRVLSIGVDKWIDQQLHPETIDDHALDVRLAPFRTVRMSTSELAENFPPPALIRQIADGKQRMPHDSEKRAIYETQLARYHEKQEKKAEPEVAALSSSEPNRSEREKDPELLKLTADIRMQALLAMDPGERGDVLATLLKGPTRDQLVEGMSPEQRENVMAMNNPQQVVSEELMQSKILRATYSERQLQEVMTDFWLNHFNVFIGKGADRYELTSYERDVIRPRALGKFEDLLVATAQSPAMLFYLDNWLSVGPDSNFANGIRRNPGRNPKRRGPSQQSQSNGKRGGLNENYGRELMELHTLGVNGGYTQKDVTEVAKVFTGWTLKQPRDGGGFMFDENKHEPGTKIVLGHKIKDKGEKEGYEVLHLLSRHPSTAKFICTKLATRFVSDNPPPELLEQMTKTFLKKDGDIREVLKAMLQSPAFWAPEAYRAKVKTPLEFVVSSLRATGADITDGGPIVHQIQNLGMPLYGAQPPTGYSMKAEAWVSSSALLGRMNFAMRLSSEKIKGAQIAPDQTSEMGDPQQALASLEKRLLGGDVSKQTHETISAQLNDPAVSRRKLDDPARPPDVQAIEGLLLGSPEFQRR